MKYIALYFILLLQSASAVNFRIDYSLDTNGFFGTDSNPDVERREAIEAVADFFSEIIQDNFLEIDNSDSQFPQASWTPRLFNPSTGAIINLEDNLVIPANEVIVFVGARDLPNSVVGQAGPAFFSASGFTPWFERIRGRGQSEADSGTASDNTDFALWGGQIAFDTLNANGTVRNWNFSLTQNLSGIDFITVALHEFCHILGIGTADSWDNLINSNDQFLGVASVRSLGENPPIQEVVRGHFADFTNRRLNSVSFGSFGTPHGTFQAAIMRPSLSTTAGRLTVLSDLDLAGLIDVGWKIRVPVAVNGFVLTTTPQTSFSWLTSSFINYQVERSTDLVTYTNLGAEVAGNGSLASIVDNAPPEDRAFYRVRTSPAFPETDSSAVPIPSNLKATDPIDGVYRKIDSKIIQPIECAICDECKGHHHQK